MQEKKYQKFHTSTFRPQTQNINTPQKLLLLAGDMSLFLMGAFPLVYYSR